MMYALWHHGLSLEVASLEQILSGKLEYSYVLPLFILAFLQAQAPLRMNGLYFGEKDRPEPQLFSII